MRFHFFEFEDLKWFPSVIRDGGTDYLRYFLAGTELYRPCIQLVRDTLKITGENRVIDLCSGSGGYIEQVCKELNANSSEKVFITLTDKFPNLRSFQSIKENSNGLIDYKGVSVDVLDVPLELKGMRVLFSAIHHFKPDQIKTILEQTVKAKATICIFDGGEKGLLPILGLLIIHPLAFALFTPFFKPVKFSRFVFTYILPLIPLYTIWDGIVSILRMYKPEELMEIAQSVDGDFTWKCGKTKNRFGLRAAYLIGYPKM